MKRILIFLAFAFVLVPFSSAQNNSIKNRWNTKLSISRSRMNYPNPSPYFWDKHPIRGNVNMRAECNYGVLDWLELGGYVGYMRYFNFYYNLHKKFRPENFAFAPTFGVNVNAHLLPLWVKNKNCRWELYLTAKYGGAYLINHVEFYLDYFSSANNEFSVLHCLPNRYRHIFGAGIGGGVYFWNLVGLYAEVMGGQYSYFPEVCNSYYTARVGIEFKFMTKTKKQKEPQHIEME